MSASDTRQSPRARLPPRVYFAECWTLALGKVPATGCGHVAILPSAGLWHSANFQIFAECFYFSTRQSMLTCAGPFAECFGLNTRQSGEFFFFCSFFLCFSIQIQQKYIYINAEVITGSYSPSHIIDNYENDIDTNNTVHHIYHKSNT